MTNKKKITRSLLLVFVAVLAFVGGTTAYFSDTETSEDNVLQAGAIDLKIDNTSYYNGEVSSLTTWELANLDDGNGPSDGKYLFFNFEDLKPGDWGEDTISLHVSNNKYWSCMDVDLTSNDDNGSVEPELSEGDALDIPEDLFDGELASELRFVFWADDGDNVLEDDEVERIIAEGSAEEVLNSASWALSDSAGNAWTGNLDDPLIGDDDYSNVYYVGKAWCFGDFAYTPVPEDQGTSPLDNPGITCSGVEATNMSQTDRLTADVSFRAVQYRHNGSFVCLGCEFPELGYASSVYAHDQGLTRDGGVIPPERSDPNAATGAPDATQADWAYKFFSLGFGGSIDLEFAYPIYGDEVSVLEVTFGRDSYPEESADVYVSPTGNSGDWTMVGHVTNHDDDGSAEVDVSGISQIKYVRLVDTSDKADFVGSQYINADGYDLDAVSAVLCTDEGVDRVVNAFKIEDLE